MAIKRHQFPCNQTTIWYRPFVTIGNHCNWLKLRFPTLSTTAVHLYTPYISISFPRIHINALHQIHDHQNIQRDKGEVDFRFSVTLNMFLLTWMCIFFCRSLYLQHSNAPVFSSPLPCGLETWQADKGHGGGDGQWSDVLQHHAGQTQRSDTHLNQRRHDDSPLDLRHKKWLWNDLFLENDEKIMSTWNLNCAAVLNYVHFQSTIQAH